jgi:hypothetical protein
MLALCWSKASARPTLSYLTANIRDLPNELLLWIVSHLDGSALFALAKSCKDLDFSFASVKCIDVGVVLEQSIRKANVVVFDGQVQQICCSVIQI